MYDLKSFVDAQNGNVGFDTALKEMRNGRKESHWMWYIFPQIKGLGYGELRQAVDKVIEEDAS